jgi:hypothetical protein
VIKVSNISLFKRTCYRHRYQSAYGTKMSVVTVGPQWNIKNHTKYTKFVDYDPWNYSSNFMEILR